MENIYIIIINFLSICIASYFSYIFSKKRYTYEKLYERKLTYLEEIYGKIISLEKELRGYINTTGFDFSEDSIKEKRGKIAPIRQNFTELKNFFEEKEIVLDESSISKIKSFIKSSNGILVEMNISEIYQNTNDIDSAYKQIKEAFQKMEVELKETKEIIKKDFRKNLERI